MQAPTDNVVEINLSAARAIKIVRKIANKSRQVRFTNHARERMKERDITMAQVIRCLKSGTITEGPARDIKGNWKLTIDSLAAGDPIKAVIALDQDKQGDYIIIVTTY